jgi:hypothetical protein
MTTQTATRQPLLSLVQRNKLSELISAVYRVQDPTAIADKLTHLAQTEFQVTSLEAMTYEQGARLTGKLLAELRSKNSADGPAPVVPPAPTAAPTPQSVPLTNGANDNPTPTPAYPQAMTQIISGEASFSWNALTSDADGWEEQWTVRGATGDEIIKRVNALKSHLIKNGYKPITRRAASANAARGEANTPESEPVPLCAIHKVPMQKRSKDGRSWWSCNEKLDDGQWCQYRPKSK